ncbi:hypothetical protein FNF29_00127 [Cafeteria roenbergensis]|uniref:Condensin complex subunit 1 C-terminal domain-containing protein n=3 Tax=Cafeteria roenbergensis TaxID=33653 RepID=A0A5A8D0P0_CAFRO|nr:hypothetical protein FNF29_00127 [Cafeteria roenbergensis]|eukprot:KAA0157551.1 hypothetical protein FNF29_00127 [Cafeteria roenbergensis]
MERFLGALANDLFDSIEGSAAAVSLDARGEGESVEFAPAPTADLLEELGASLSPLVLAIHESPGWSPDQAAGYGLVSAPHFWEALQGSRAGDTGVGALVRLLLAGMRSAQIPKDKLAGVVTCDKKGSAPRDRALWRCGNAAAVAYLALMQVPGARSFDAVHEAAIILAAEHLEASATAVSFATRAAGKAGGASAEAMSGLARLASARTALDAVLASIDVFAPWVASKGMLRSGVAAHAVAAAGRPGAPADSDPEKAAAAASDHGAGMDDADADADADDDDDDDDGADADASLELGAAKPSWHQLDVSKTPVRAVAERLPAALALAQHAVTGAADTAPARRRAAAAVAGIMPALPHQYRRALAAFLRRLSRCSSARRRSAAVDAMGACLMATPVGPRCPAGTAGWTLWADAGSPSQAEAAAAALVQAAVSASAVDEDDEGVYEDSDDEDSGSAGRAGEGSSPFASPSARGCKARTARTPATALSGRRRSTGARRAHVATPGSAGLGALTPVTGRGRASVGGASTASGFGAEELEGQSVATLARSLGRAWTGAVLADALVRRCSDRSPAVRARGLVVCGTLVSETSKTAGWAAGQGPTPSVAPRAVAVAAMQAAARHMAREAAAAAAQEAGASAAAAKVVSSVTDASFLLAGGEDGDEDDPAPLSPLLPLLLRRMQDPKPAVRKAAVAMLGGVAVSGGFCAAGRADADDEESDADSGDGGHGPGSKASAPAAGLADAGTAATRKTKAKQRRRAQDSGSESDSESDSGSESDGDERARSRASASALPEAATSSGSVADRGPLAGCAWADLSVLAGGIASGERGRAQAPSSCVGVYALQALAAACADESTSVRKAALDAISLVFQVEPSTPAVHQLWLACAPPMAMDTEPTVAKAAVAAVAAGLLVPVATLKPAPCSGGPGVAVAHHASSFVWSALAAMVSHPDLVSCLRTCVAAAAADGLVDLPALAKATWRFGCSVPGAEGAPQATVEALNRCAGAWALLDAVARAVAAADAKSASGESATSSRTAGVAAASAAAAPARRGQACGPSKALKQAGVTDAAVGEAWAQVDRVLSDAQAGTGAFARDAADPAGRALVVGRITAMASTVLEVLAQVSGSLVVAEGAGKGRVLRVRADDIGVTGSGTSRLSETARRAGATCGALVEGCLRFAWPSSLVSSAVSAAGMLARTAALPAVAKALPASARDGAFVLVAEEDLDSAAADLWAPRLLEACEAGLVGFVVQTGGATGHAGAMGGLPRDPAALEDAVVRRLFLAGQVCLWGLDVNNNDVTPGRQKQRGLAKRARAALEAGEETAGIRVPAALVSAIQAAAAPTITADDAVSAGSEARQTPPAVRAHAFAALGKACLRLPKVAKASVAAFVRELSAGHASGSSVTGSAPAIRNNALFALADLCVRYTSLVDVHLPAIAAACADEHPAVRRHAVLLLSQLVQRDFIKWRPVLFHRLAAAMADPVPSVRSAASDALTGPLNLKDPHLLPGMLVEGMFVLAGCVSHPEMNRDGRAAALADPASERAALAAGPAWSEQSWRRRFSPQDPRGLALLGPGARRRRLGVMRQLLRAMSDDGRLKVLSKLVTDVVGAAADGAFSLPPRTQLARHASAAALSTPGGAGSAGPGVATVPDGEQAPAGPEAMIMDALELLASEELRFGASAAARADADADGAVDELTGGGAASDAAAQAGGATTTAQAVAAATRKALAGVARRFVLETGVPAAIGVRSDFARARSPAAGRVLVWLCSVAEHYGEQAVREALANDPRLADEVTFDVRRAAKARVASERKRKRSAAAARAEAVRELAEVALARRAGHAPVLPGAPSTPGSGSRARHQSRQGASPEDFTPGQRNPQAGSRRSSSGLASLSGGITPRPLAGGPNDSLPLDARSPAGHARASEAASRVSSERRVQPSALKLAVRADTAAAAFSVAAASLAAAADSDSDGESDDGTDADGAGALGAAASASRTVAMASPDAKPLRPRKWGLNAERMGADSKAPQVEDDEAEAAGKPAKRARAL